jgi:hypothetical protein
MFPLVTSTLGNQLAIDGANCRHSHWLALGQKFGPLPNRLTRR